MARCEGFSWGEGKLVRAAGGVGRLFLRAAAGAAHQGRSVLVGIHSEVDWLGLSVHTPLHLLVGLGRACVCVCRRLLVVGTEGGSRFSPTSVQGTICFSGPPSLLSSQVLGLC